MADARAEAKREYDARRYLDNREKILEQVNRYFREHEEIRRAQIAEWRNSHPSDPAKAHAYRVSPQGRAQGRKHAASRRARILEAFVENFSHEEIFERDDWVCQLCGVPVDPELVWPDRLSASLDHIVPLSRGGFHSRENCQLAHLVCNIRKGGDLTYDREPSTEYKLVKTSAA